MFGKLFPQMFEGSLVDAGWEAIVTLQQLVILANVEGVIDKTPDWISRTTTIPIDIITKGLAAFFPLSGLGSWSGARKPRITGSAENGNLRS